MANRRSFSFCGLSVLEVDGCSYYSSAYQGRAMIGAQAHMRCAPFTATSRPCSSPMQLKVQSARNRRSRVPLCAVAEAGEASAAAAEARTAKEAVETGLERFQAGDNAAALALFMRARELGPDADEARAALYNCACAYARMARWREASECVISAGECCGEPLSSSGSMSSGELLLRRCRCPRPRRRALWRAAPPPGLTASPPPAAVNDYDLKLSVALRDPDLERLRETREWSAALASLRDRGGLSEEGYVRAREEIKAPFRLFRLFFLGGLTIGDTIGLFFSVAQLITALKGARGCGGGVRGRGRRRCWPPAPSPSALAACWVA